MPPHADSGRIRRPALISAAAVVALIAPATAAASFVHVVAPGESLSSVAASDGLSVAQLAAANGLSPEASLLEGSSLVIPSQEPGSTVSGREGEETQASSAGLEDSDAQGEDGDEQGGPSGQAASTSEGVSASGGGAYVVQPGDTLSAIAASHGISLEELAAANGIDASAPLLSGSVLQLSGSSGEAAHPGSSAASSQPEGAAAAGSENAPPYPTEETVTPSEVASIAAENSVSPSLTEAVAAEESGFNNNVTSSADARGVMQILPGTWNWIGENLSAAPLAPASAASNVRGGVLLLHSLLESTGGDPELALAGYYQGLPSVREEGELPSTEQYVQEVLARQQQYGGG